MPMAISVKFKEHRYNRRLIFARTCTGV